MTQNLYFTKNSKHFKNILKDDRTSTNWGLFLESVENVDIEEAAKPMPRPPTPEEDAAYWKKQTEDAYALKQAEAKKKAARSAWSQELLDRIKIQKNEANANDELKKKEYLDLIDRLHWEKEYEKKKAGMGAVATTPDEKKCIKCKKDLFDDDATCPYCGASQPLPPAAEVPPEDTAAAAAEVPPAAEAPATSPGKTPMGKPLPKLPPPDPWRHKKETDDTAYQKDVQKRKQEALKKWQMDLVKNPDAPPPQLRNIVEEEWTAEEKEKGYDKPSPDRVKRDEFVKKAAERKANRSVKTEKPKEKEYDQWGDLKEEELNKIPPLR